MSVNPNSILDTVKKAIGFESEYTAFDVDIVLHINSAISTLQQMGAGPSAFFIENNTTLWSDYITRRDLLNLVKQYIFMSSRLAFDTPERFGITAIENQLAQLAWRINIAAENPTAVGTPGEWWILDGLLDFTLDALPGDFGFDTITGNVYVNGTLISAPFWWDLTGLTDFPLGSIIGELGYDPSTGQVWRKTA